MTAAATGVLRVVIASEETEASASVRQAALSHCLECDASDVVSYAELPVRLAQGQANVVLVHVRKDLSAALKVIELATGCTSAPIIAVGPAGRPERVSLLLAGGARAYLEEDRLAEELPETLRQLSQTGFLKVQQGRVLAVTAAIPGTGISTVACNLAFALAAKHPGRVALAELGRDVPQLGLMLDLKPQNTLADLPDNFDRLDATMMRQLLVEHAGVHVLADEPGALRPTVLEPEPMRRTLSFLRAMFEYVVLDLGAGPDESLRPALIEAEAVLVVVRLDVPSLRLSRRLIHHLADLGVPAEKLRVVANRYGQKKQIAWTQAVEAIGLSIMESIPDDPITMNQALNEGLPLVAAARRASITRSFDKLASQLNGRTL